MFGSSGIITGTGGPAGPAAFATGASIGAPVMDPAAAGSSAASITRTSGTAGGEDMMTATPKDEVQATQANKSRARALSHAIPAHGTKHFDTQHKEKDCSRPSKHYNPEKGHCSRNPFCTTATTSVNLTEASNAHLNPATLASKAHTNKHVCHSKPWSALLMVRDSLL